MPCKERVAHDDDERHGVCPGNDRVIRLRVCADVRGSERANGLDRWLLHFGKWGIIGGKGFFLHEESSSPFVLLWFFLTLARLNIAVAVPTGALAERWRFKSFVNFSLLLAAIIFPIYACWVWGGGWIAQFGGVDYAGSSVIHLQAGAIALVAAWLLGPRIGKYDLRDRPRPILGHHVPMAISGSLILAAAWMALNAAQSFAVSDGRIYVIAVNSALAAAAGAVAASLHLSFVYGKSDPTLICNGMLGGLVAIAAPCAFVAPWAALLIGAMAGVLTVWFIFFLERRGIDDPVGVISVHGVSGFWGVLALGLFADGTFANGMNSLPAGHGVTGLFYGDGKQLACQCVMAGACLAWAFIAGGIGFQLVGKLFGPNRVPREVELAGLDIPEVGVPAYPEFFNPLPAATGFVAEPRPATSPSVTTGQRRFSIVIEGIDATSLINTWSSLCQVGAAPPPPEFTEVYPFVTTVTGNRFRFSGGDPVKIKENLSRLFQSKLASAPISAKVES